MLFTNNYDMHLARAGWRLGAYPSHHLFGTAYLGPQFDVVDVRYREDDVFARFTRYSRSLLGDVGSQLRVLSALRRGSIIYAAQAHEVTGLALARRQGLLRAPIVGVFHGVRWRLPLHRASLAGFDRAIAMSKLTAQALIRENYPADRISVLNWGPDLEFTEFSPEAPRSSEGGVVATGKTARDWRTLIEALARTGARARIYAGESVSACRLPDNVEVVPSVALQAVAGGALHLRTHGA